MIINDKHRFVFYHVPKNAGSTVRALFKGKEGDSPYDVRDAHETPSQLHRRVPKTKGYFAWAIKRNPWSRMESSYRHLMKTSDGQRNKGVKFATFVRQLNHAGTWPYKCRAYYPVLRPQIDWLDDGKFVTVLKFENLEEEVRALALQWGIKIGGFPHLNASPGLECVWTDEAREVFERLYERDVKELGYVVD